MKYFNSNNQNQQVNSISNVNQLTNFDMIYVYHLLTKGVKLNLFKCNDKLNGDLVFKVMFQSFKIGYVNVSGIAKQLFKGQSELEATVFSVTKEKYLPLKNLEISMQHKSLKMVS